MVEEKDVLVAAVGETEAAVPVSMKAVPDPCFAQVFALSGRGNGVGGVCDMAAADDVVGMEDAEPRHLAGIGFGYGRAGLGSEEGAGFLKARGSVWGKATPAATTSFRIAVMAGRPFSS